VVYSASKEFANYATGNRATYCSMAMGSSIFIHIAVALGQFGFVFNNL
tara:strand:+ start:922 stop:1065 length:144 start_codon:yes stop_codon:yes gene_type:complete